MRKSILKILILIILFLIVIEGFKIIYEKYEKREVIQSYFNNETDFNYKSDMIIKIPKIKLENVVIKASKDFSNLDDNLVYYENNNYDYSIIILGHSGIGHGTYFSRLDEVNINDEVQLYIDDTLITYLVKDTYVIDETETSILDNKENDSVFLITCVKGNNKKRLVVKGIIKSKKNLKSKEKEAKSLNYFYKNGTLIL